MEHRERREGRASVSVEEVVTPIDGGAQRALSRGRIASAAIQERQRMLEPRRELRYRQNGGPRGCQLDRQRQPIQAPAQGDDGRALGVVQSEIGVVVARACQEQFGCVLVA